METHSTLIKPQRDSSYELLRILSQVFIVLYHLCYIWQGDPYRTTPFFQAVCLPLHIGVVIFVLLSGFFTIKASSKGLIKLLSIFIVYTLPEIVFGVISSNDILYQIQNLFFLSNTHFWFIKTYLFLYLVSPMINLWLNNANEKKRWYMLTVFAFVACYMATTGGDKAMVSGKNLVNFIFLYLVGNQLWFYRERWQKISTLLLIGIFITMNAILMGAILQNIPIVTKIVKSLAFPYSSPLLLLNSIVFFMIIGKQKIQSHTINYAATSSLAIYLIHGNRPYVRMLHEEVCVFFQGCTNNMFLLLTAYLLYTIIIVIVCIFIDKLLTPLWKQIDKMGIQVNNKLGF